MSHVLRWVFVAAVVLGLLFDACTTSSIARVSGVVTIAACGFGNCPGRPVPEIGITFAGASGQRATTVTDSSGAYAITLTPGDYDVTLAAGPNRLSFQVSDAITPPAESAKIHTSSGQDLDVNFQLFSALATLLFGTS
jgi:hypothetical protein